MSLFNKELNRHFTIYDRVTLDKVGQTIKIGVRLKEIAREVNFCKDNKINISEEKINKMLEESLASL